MALTLRRHDRTGQPPARATSSTPSLRQPFAELDRLTRDLDQYLDLWRRQNVGTDLFTPFADLEETDDAYLIDLEVPGVHRGDIDVEISGRRLTVRGERKDKQRIGILRRRERVVGTFSYDVTLPGDIVEADVTAELIDGVLVVRLPKPADQRPRHIQIT